MRTVGWASAIANCGIVLGFSSIVATAGVFETQTRLLVAGNGYVVNTPWADSFTQDYPASPFLTGIERFFDDPYTGGEGPYAARSYAAAFTSPFAPDFLGAGAYAITGYSGARAYAGWRDVAYVASYGGPGSSIRLNYTVSAYLGGLVGSRSSIEIFGGVLVGDETWTDGAQSLGVVQFTDAGVWDPETSTVVPNPVFDVAGPWDSYSIVSGQFFGATHLDVPYDEYYGGYSWQLGIEAKSGAQYSSGFASSLNSVRLITVTDLEGNVLSGVTLDSGMSLVPEPSTVALAISAGMCFLSLARLRSLRRKPAGVRG